MDILSQAVVGSCASQSLTQTQQKYAFIVGAVSAVLPDLDVFIRSETDPLLFLEYHRQFTHSLLFVPILVLLSTSIFYVILKKKLYFKQIYLFSLFSVLTHGLLDTCTSYGTQLLWPFSDERLSWNIISIIDPLFTIPILIGTSLGVYYKTALYSRISLLFLLIYLSFGVVQHNRAEKVIYKLAEESKHEVERFIVKPSFGNQILWKGLYQSGDYYYVNAIKLGTDTQIFKGDSIKVLDLEREFPWLKSTDQHYKDIERFRIFSNDYLAVDPKDPYTIIDVRYSFLPNKIRLMWGIRLHPPNSKQPHEHVRYVVDNKLDKDTRHAFLKMVFQ